MSRILDILALILSIATVGYVSIVFSVNIFGYTNILFPFEQEYRVIYLEEDIPPKPEGAILLTVHIPIYDYRYRNHITSRNPQYERLIYVRLLETLEECETLSKEWRGKLVLQTIKCSYLP